MTYDQQETGARPERLLKVLAAATFVIFFQAYMVAPLIPRLAVIFHTSIRDTGLVVPAYLVPYGVATLAYGFLADRVGIWRIMIASLLIFVMLTVLTATANSLEALAVWRGLTGFGASGVVPLALVLVSRLYPYRERGRPLGWLFGAMAGGAAVGSTIGSLVEPLIGWRGLFLTTGAAGASVALLLLRHKPSVIAAVRPATGTLAGLLSVYGALLGSARGARTYAFVFLNSVFHAGVFTWLGFYFEQRYGLGPAGIGLALLGYGLPGFVLGPVIGRAADAYGRGVLIPIGLGVGALAAVALAFNLPLIGAALAVTLLSLGYDMTQPLFAGIVTTLGGERAGQAMGLNVFLLFLGFGLGSLLFGEMLRFGEDTALLSFAALASILMLGSIKLFATEVPQPGPEGDPRRRHEA